MEKIVILRDATPDDTPAILGLQRLTPEAAPWSEADYAGVLGTARTVCLLAEDRVWERLVGFLLARMIADEMEILNLAVAPDYRRRGIARRLLAETLARAQAAGVRQCWLEMRASNCVALEFYRALGFGESHRRWRYYRDPVDDAVVYLRRLAAAGPAP